jgi:hypothetical protein
MTTTFLRYQETQELNNKSTSVHFCYEPNMSHVYADPTAYNKVDAIYKEEGYLEEGFVSNNYSPDQFALKDGYVCCFFATDDDPDYCSQAASESYAIFFEGNEIARIYDGVIAEVVEVEEIWKLEDEKYIQQ